MTLILIITFIKDFVFEGKKTPKQRTNGLQVYIYI